jgi:hypothetical protein
MRRMNRLMILALALVGLVLSACSEGGTEGVLAGEPAPVTVSTIEGSDLKLVQLVTRSAERLGIQTEPVRQDLVDGERRLVIPYAALLYDEHGDTWVFTNTEGLSFIRQSVIVDRIVGDLAILTDGPTSGTLVVTLGASELYGAETGVGGGH